MGATRYVCVQSTDIDEGDVAVAAFVFGDVGCGVAMCF
jgi:hypothetical protein